MLRGTDSYLAVLDARETIFFGRSSPDGPLRQWIEVTIDNRAGRELEGKVTISAGGEDVETPVQIKPAQHTYRCDAPTLWPKFEPALSAPVTVEAGGCVATGTATVGSHRPWTLYLLSDCCVDYTWVYDDLESLSLASAAVVKEEIEACRETAGQSFANQNRYNVLHTSELEYFLQHASPEEVEEWVRLTKSGHFTLSPYPNLAMTAAQTLEEGIRQFYPARRLERRWGIDIGYANHQETPTITWSQAMVLAGSSIRHLVKSIYPYLCPWNDRLVEPPLYYWEGPDSSRILVRHRKNDYVEGRFILEGVEAIDTKIHQEIIPGYETLGETYPFDAIGLVGMYGDLVDKTREYAAVKARNVAAYNARPWEYPRLVNASHTIFWQDIDAQLEARPITVPIYRGDYGTGWDAWPISLAKYYAGWRRAQERSYTADCLAAIISTLDGTWYEGARDALEEGWSNMLRLSDHAWNGSGSDDRSRELNARLRRDAQEKANARFDRVIERALGKRIRTGVGQSVLVFNALGWTRSGLVRVRGLGEGPFTVRDGVSDEVLPSQVVHEGGEPVLCFQAIDVPAMGYRTYQVSPGSEPDGSPVEVTECSLENEYYHIEVSPSTGGIASFRDKVHDCELVDPASPYHLNQLLYLSGGDDLRLGDVTIVPGAQGPVMGQLVVKGSAGGAILQTTLTLYARSNRLDIRNELHKEPCSDEEQINFAFPFNVPGRRYRLETPGAIIVSGDTTHGGEQRPGSGQAVNSVRHFVDAYNDSVGVTMVSLDSGVVQFGHRTQAEAPRMPDPTNCTVLALVLGNATNYREFLHDQHRQTDFTFRFSLYGHGRGFDAVQAIRRGMEAAQDLPTILLDAHQQGPLPEGVHSFLQVEPDQVILSALKVADEGPDKGVVLRLWRPGQVDGQTEARIDVAGWGELQEARLTDLLERDQRVLPVLDGSVNVSVESRGLATVRLKIK